MWGIVLLMTLEPFVDISKAAFRWQEPPGLLKYAQSKDMKV